MIDIELLTLVARAQVGDRQAFGQLVERFQSMVQALALSRLHDFTDAQELTQDVFMHAMDKLHQLRDPKCFVGWLRQITVRMALNRISRGALLQGADSEILQNEPAPDQTPLELLVQAEQRAKVLKGLEQLKPLDRATLEAYYLQGKSIEQMSHLFGTPIGTIKRRLHVARKRLRQKLERQQARKARRRRKLATV